MGLSLRSICLRNTAGWKRFHSSFQAQPHPCPFTLDAENWPLTSGFSSFQTITLVPHAHQILCWFLHTPVKSLFVILLWSSDHTQKQMTLEKKTDGDFLLRKVSLLWYFSLSSLCCFLDTVISLKACDFFKWFVLLIVLY